jgi:hypothetical protein
MAGRDWFSGQSLPLINLVVKVFLLIADFNFLWFL